MVESVGSALAENDLASIDVTDKPDSAIATGVFEDGDLDVSTFDSTQTEAYLSPVYVDRSDDADQVRLDLVLLSDSALVEIMPKSKQTLMSAKTDMAVFDYKPKHMTVNESEESLLALINSENLCLKHVRQNASEYILPVEIQSSLLCRLQLWKGIKGVQRCLYVKLIDGNFVYDKGKSHVYANEWQEAGVEGKMKVSMDAVTYNSVLAELNKYEMLSYSLPNRKPPRLPPANVLKIDVFDDDVAELEKGEDNLLESMAILDSHMLSVGQIVVQYGDHAEFIQVRLKPPRDILLRGPADETNRINIIHVGICLPSLVYVSPEKRPSYDLNKKAKAVNTSVHVSASMANVPFILNLDCHHYIYSSQALRDGMCCFVIARRGDCVCYVQFPQRFEGIDPSDGYANQNTVSFNVNMLALDGLQGPFFVETGCLFSSDALYSFDSPRAKEGNPTCCSCCFVHLKKNVAVRHFAKVNRALRIGDSKDEGMNLSLLPKKFGNSIVLIDSIPVAVCKDHYLGDHLLGALLAAVLKVFLKVVAGIEILFTLTSTICGEDAVDKYSLDINLTLYTNGAACITNTQEAFDASCDKLASMENGLSGRLAKVLDHVGETVVDAFFIFEKGGVSWIEFMNGSMKWRGRVSASLALGNLLKAFALSSEKAGFCVDLGFGCDEEAARKLSYMNHTIWSCLLYFCLLVPEDAADMRKLMELMSCFHCFLSECISWWWNYLQVQNNLEPWKPLNQPDQCREIEGGMGTFLCAIKILHRA